MADFYVKYNVSSNAIIDYEIDIENTTSELEQVMSGSLSELSSSTLLKHLIKMATA